MRVIYYVRLLANTLLRMAVAVALCTLVINAVYRLEPAHA